MDGHGTAVGFGDNANHCGLCFDRGQQMRPTSQWSRDSRVLSSDGFGKLVSGVFWVIFYRELFMPDDHGAGTILSTHRLRQMVYFLFSLEAVFIFYGFVVTFHSRLSESECPTFVHAFSVLTLVLLTIVTGFAILIPVMAGVPLEWHLPPPLHEAGAEGVITETELEAEESMEAGRMPTLAELGEEA